ncbi:trypsin-like cysteine/serine peptidase domain-containing protein [Apiospora phragmitis]|uniref:Trypsin-like cysteine/serine peptidase domain-containing protein n=1 Tax=Apiospora phragmitis TaxID=2905665 RepID=A0ABR1WQZ4_9PEZI
MSRFTAFALALCLTSLSTAVPVGEQPALTDFQPIGILPPGEADDQFWAAIAPPEAVTLTQADLAAFHNVTEAPNGGGNAAALQEKRWAIGNDDRVLWTNRDYPYSAMGKITFPGSWCSASLIGPRLVATAKHCYQPGVPYRFNPAYDNGEVLPGSYATRVILSSDPASGGPCNEKEDWALFVLDAKLGDQLGYLGAKVYDAASQAGRAVFFNYGYPQDKSGGSRPYRMEGISVTRKEPRCDSTGPLDTDMDVSPGNSRGPAVAAGGRGPLPVRSHEQRVAAGWAAAVCLVRVGTELGGGYLECTAELPVEEADMWSW